MAQLGLPEVYRVGGSVRDQLLGRQAKDSDYMVRGAAMGDIAVALNVAGAKISPLQLNRPDGYTQIGWRADVKGVGTLEIVLPRSEVSTGPGRHDFDIYVDKDLALDEDARRRDFTVNALYLNVKTQEIVDPLNRGRQDLEKMVLNTTHSTSFSDDPLRILRGLRFVSTRGFDLTLGTAQEMSALAKSVTGLTVKGVSGTALEELSKLLMGMKPGYALELMADQGVMEHFLPELAPMIGFDQRSRYHEKTTSQHVFDAVQAAAQMHSHAPLRVRMALLFHDSGKPKMAWTDENGLQHYYALSVEQLSKYGANGNSLMSHEWWGAELANDALNRLNAPKQLRKDVVRLIERHMLPLHENIKPFKVRKLRSELGDELLRDLITHRLCDVLGKGGDTTEAVEVLEWIANEQKRAIAADVPVSVGDLKINGKELVDIGLRGPEIGEILRTLLHEVLAQPALNTNDWLAKRANSLQNLPIF
jgi:tRNA nucleotidyltransferase (CCA-adding enzyme)